MQQRQRSHDRGTTATGQRHSYNVKDMRKRRPSLAPNVSPGNAALTSSVSNPRKVINIIRSTARRSLHHSDPAPALALPTALPTPMVTWPLPRERPTREDTIDTPGTNTLFKPVVCPHCTALLHWSNAAPIQPFTNCGRCAMSISMSIRTIQRPSAHDLPHHDRPAILLSPEQIRQQPRALHTDDFRWTTVRQHPHRTNSVYVFRGETVIAHIPLQQARYMRALLLASWPTTSSTFRVNENDVAAFICAITLSQPPDQWPSPHQTATFPGDCHVFMSFEHHAEPGFLRPAILPSSSIQPHWADPSTSAYTDVTHLGAPLSALEYDTLLQGHPLRGFITNNIRCGFPLLAEPPRTTHRITLVDYPLNSDPRTHQQAQFEFDDQAFLSTADWPTTVPLRFSPWIPIEQKAKVRCISDLSIGEDSTNRHTRRKPLLPARLASWPIVAKRINYMAKQRPGVNICMAKFDVSRAFRKCPIPVRDFWKTAHTVLSQSVVHTRLPFGATCSVDNMSTLVSAVQDVVAAQHGIFTQSYVDDQIIIDYEDAIDQSVDIVAKIWATVGLPRNVEKFLKEGKPATVMEFLGIQLDTIKRTASITQKRLESIRALLDEWATGKVRSTPRRIKSLAGTLNFVATVIPFGRVFIQQLYKWADNNHHQCYIPTVAMNDIKWWQQAVHQFNGAASFQPANLSSTTMTLATDAAKAGWGIVNANAQQFAAGSWTTFELTASSTAHWEAAAIALACALYGHTVSSGFLVIQSDSSAATAVFNGLRASDARMTNILRYAVLLQLRHSFRLIVQHIPGVTNTLADSASRRHCLPTSHEHFQKVDVPATARQAIWKLLAASPTQPNLGLDLAPLPSATSTGTAQRCDTTPVPTLPWIVWNPIHFTPVAQEDLRTSLSGCDPIRQ